MPMLDINSLDRTRRAKASTVQYVVAGLLLVMIVGTITWWKLNSKGNVSQPTPNVQTQRPKLLDFPNGFKANWQSANQGKKEAMKTKSENRNDAGWATNDGKKKEEDKASSQGGEDSGADPAKEIVYKEVEFGSKGHYDFFFRNASEGDVQVLPVFRTFSGIYCDCSQVMLAELQAAEWEKLVQAQKKAPSESLTYSVEPKWTEIIPDNRALEDARAKGPGTIVKQGAVGVVRITWIVKKAADQPLHLDPMILYQPTKDASRRDFQGLFVPVMVRQPIEFLPRRASVGILEPGASGRATFKVWSATRDKLDFEFSTIPADPLLTVTATKLSAEYHANLENAIKESTKGSTPKVTRILSAYDVTVTAHESKPGGKQLEQGIFYRTLGIKLDGRISEIKGPIVDGRVQGDVQIGGDADGVLRFKGFDVKLGAAKSIPLAAKDAITLEVYNFHPDWVKVELTRKDVEDGLRRWNLEVRVPAAARDARSFEHPDAVTLRISGSPERFVRIPLEGSATGGQ